MRQQHARLRALGAGLLAAASLPLRAENEIHVTNDFQFIHNTVDGPGAEASNLTEGPNVLDYLNLYGSGGEGKNSYRYSLGGKGTDDPANDLNKYTLTNANADIRSGAHGLGLGDVYEYFSQYSLGTSLKGAAYRLRPENSGTEVTALWGAAYPRWDNIWGGEDLEVVNRQGYGGRIKQRMGSALDVGVNGVFVRETDRVTAADSLTDGDTFSADWELRAGGAFTLSGESAMSRAALSPQENAAEAESRGTAHRAALTAGGGRNQMILDYERVTHDFVSQLGAASPDREKAKGEFRAGAGRLSWRGALLWYRDNLEHQKDGTTHSWKPETTFSLKRFLGRKYGVADLFYRYDRRYGPSTDARDHYANLTLRDRFGIWDADAQGGFTRYDDPMSQKRSEYTYRLGFNGRKTLGKMVLKPSLSGGGWSGHDHQTDQDDQSVDYAAALGAEWPGLGLTAEARGGQNVNNKSGAESDYTRGYGNLVLRLRPRAAAWRGYTLYVSGYHNDFDYTLEGLDFRETSVTTGLTMEF